MISFFNERILLNMTLIRDTVTLAFLAMSREKGAQGQVVWTLRKLYLFYGYNIFNFECPCREEDRAYEPQELRIIELPSVLSSPSCP